MIAPEMLINQFLNNPYVDLFKIRDILKNADSSRRI